MQIVRETFVQRTAPNVTNVHWVDTSDPQSPKLKVYVDGEWRDSDSISEEEVKRYAEEVCISKDSIDTAVTEKPDDTTVPSTNAVNEILKDKISEPVIAGTEGQILQLDAELNPIWATIQGEGIIPDVSMSGTSTNAVQNQVIKAYVDDTAAKKEDVIEIDATESTLFVNNNCACGIADGSLIANEFMMSSDYVTIPAGVTAIELPLPAILAVTAGFGLCFYDTNKTYIEGVNSKEGSDSRGAVIRRVIVPDGAKFFRTTYWNENYREQYPEITQDFYCKLYRYEVVDVSNTFNLSNELSYIDYTNGSWINTSAAFSGTTNFVDISNVYAMRISIALGLYNSLSGYGFYDENKNFILGYLFPMTTGTRKSKKVNVNIPDGAKYFRTTYWIDSAITLYSLPEFSAEFIYKTNEAIDGLKKSSVIFEDAANNFNADFNGIHPMPRFSPVGTCGVYRADTQTEAPTIDDMAADMIAAYDALMLANQDRMSKTDLGLASDGVSHLYAYNIKPMLPSIIFRSNQGTSGKYYDYVWREYPQPTIVVTSGVHGDEKGAVTALYNLIDQMLGADANDETSFILNNTNLCIIPIVNPYGYDHKQRYNYNNKDINNDYGDFTQAESIIIRDYVDSLSNVAGFLDCHNCFTRPSVWAEAGNEVAKSFVVSVYPYLLEQWKDETPGISSHTPMMHYYVNGWRGVASNYFFGKGIVAMTAETVCSYQNNIVDNNADFTQYDAFAVQMGMDMYANALIHILKAIAVAGKYAKGQETFKVISAPADATISSGGNATFSVVATGFVLSYRWQYSKDNGTTWKYFGGDTDYSQKASPILTVSYDQAVDGELIRCEIKDNDQNRLYSGTATITKL